MTKNRFTGLVTSQASDEPTANNHSEDFFQVVARSLVAILKTFGVMVGFVMLGATVTSVLPAFGSIMNTIIIDVIVAGIVCWIRRYRPQWLMFSVSRPVTGLRDVRVRWSFAALLPAFVAGQALGAVMSSRMPTGSTTYVEPSTATQWVFWILFSVGVAPICEEALLRGLLYPLIRRGDRAKPALATVLTTVVFAALHANSIQFATVLPLSVLACMAYERTQRLWLPIALHASFNVLATTVPASTAVWLAKPPVVVASLATTAVMLWLLSVYGVGKPANDADDTVVTVVTAVTGDTGDTGDTGEERVSPANMIDPATPSSQRRDSASVNMPGRLGSSARGLLTNGHRSSAGSNPGSPNDPSEPSEPDSQDPFRSYGSYDPYR